MRARITKRLVDSVKPPAKGRTVVYDTTLTGFGLTAYASGRRSFFIEYGPRGRRRRMVLGQYGALTVDTARTMAQAKLGEVAQGEDPLEAREARAAVPTFAAWMDEYMDGVRRRKKHPRHDERYLGMARDKWGSKALDQIDRRAVQALMEKVAERGNTTANRWLASVRACLQAARRAGLINDNPASAIRPFREGDPRARVLSDEEFARVVDAIAALDDRHVRGAFVMLMDTGARKSEVLRARWEDIDLDGGLWRIPSPKAGRPQVVPLGESTVAFLRGLERLGPWLVPGRDPKRHRVDLKRAWNKIRADAEVQDVTIHDLRRTFGLHVAKRAGLHIASKLLRHSDIRVTERVYVPLGIEAMREALAETHKERGKVIELERERRRAG